MICYRDRTYCPFFPLCKKSCDRALTAEIKVAAEKEGLPIAQYMEFPKCFVRWFE